MRKLKFTLLLAIATTLTSCGASITNQPSNAEGFETIEKEIKSKFGENAYYTDLTITYNKSIGNIIGVSVTEAPESLKMGQWNLTQDTWMQNSEITLEVPEGTKAADYMFQLNDKINLKTLGELVEKSKKQLEADKSLENTMLNNAYVKYPNNGDIANAEYTVMLKPENGGTTFTFRYKLSGELIEMDY